MYLLDHNAATYADTLRDSVHESAVEAGVAAMTILGEMRFPALITWVEFDYRELVVARFERDSPATAHDDRPIGSGHRGFLLDGRPDDHVMITMFSRGSGSRIMDPLCALRVNRNGIGKLDYDNVVEELSRSMVDFRVTSETRQKRSRLCGRCIASIQVTTSSSLSRSLPCWQKSHPTIRIGPQAIAHMQERQARLEFEREVQSSRNGPVRHWVSEHERRYRSGKVVLIQSHRRGRDPSANLPTRVMGPDSSRPIS